VQDPLSNRVAARHASRCCQNGVSKPHRETSKIDLRRLSEQPPQHCFAKCWDRSQCHDLIKQPLQVGCPIETCTFEANDLKRSSGKSSSSHSTTSAFEHFQSPPDKIVGAGTCLGLDIPQGHDLA
jgi:hypothetical protein